MQPISLSSSPEPPLQRELSSASSTPAASPPLDSNMVSPEPPPPRRPRRSLLPPAPLAPRTGPPWDPREDSLMRSLKAGNLLIKWRVIASRINSLRLGWTRQAEDCRVHWLQDLMPAPRTRRVGRKRTHDAAGLEEETAPLDSGAARREAAGARLQAAAAASGEPSTPRASYVDAAALEAAAEATTSAQAQPNTPGYFYNCLLLAQDLRKTPPSGRPMDLGSVAEWMAKSVAPGGRQLDSSRHFHLAVCARYKDATGNTIQLGRLRRAISHVLDAGNRNVTKWLGWCSMVRQAEMTWEEMEAERGMHVTEKVRRREEEVKSGRFKWILVAALYDEFERRDEEFERRAKLIAAEREDS